MRVVRNSFKVRLTLTITAVFVAAGAALTAGQLLVLNLALNHNFSQVSVGSAPGTVSQQAAPSAQGPPAPRPEGVPTGRAPIEASCGGSAAQSGQVVDCAVTGMPVAGSDLSTALGRNILRDTALGELGVLAAFAAIAAVLAWWLTRKALSRVGEVTNLARDISEHDLSRRLDLPGPRDEIKELADTLDVMLGRLEGAFESQERFISNASHELRGPLTATRAALEAPLAQGRFPADVQPFVSRALEANRRSERLIAALLQLARARTVHDAQPGSVDLTQITADMLDLVADDATARHVRVSADLPGPVLLPGHETLLTQAVFNVLDNAIRHNHDGGDLSVNLVSRPDGARLTVENTGIRHAPGAVRDLTQPFHRAAGSRLASAEDGGRPGLGLGLALVESIVQAHHGRLEITARETGGLHVALTLPHPAREGSVQGAAAPAGPVLVT